MQRAWNEIMNVVANPKGSVGRWNLNFWRLEIDLYIVLGIWVKNEVHPRNQAGGTNNLVGVPKLWSR